MATVYRAKVVFLAEEMDLVGIAQNQSDGRVLVIAEGEKKDDLERFASAIKIEKALIHMDNMDAKYSQGSGQYSTFRKITGSDKVGERLDEGLEILKEMLTGIKSLTVGVNNLTAITTDGFETAPEDGSDGSISKMQPLEKFRGDLKGHMDMRFKRIEADLGRAERYESGIKRDGIIVLNQMNDTYLTYQLTS